MPSGADTIRSYQDGEDTKVSRRENGAHRLPKPKAKSFGSRAPASYLPSRMNRSGRNSNGSGNTSGSCIQALSMRRMLFNLRMLQLGNTRNEGLPNIGQDDSPCGDVISTELIVIDRAVRRSQRKDVVVPKAFGNDCVHIDERRSVAEVW